MGIRPQWKSSPATYRRVDVSWRLREHLPVVVGPHLWSLLRIRGQYECSQDAEAPLLLPKPESVHHRLYRGSTDFD